MRALGEQDWPGVAFLTPEGRYEYVSPRFAAMNGLEPEELVGRLAQEVAPELWREGAQAFERSRRGETATFELQAQLQTDQSRSVTWLVNVFPVYEDSSLVGVVATVADVTALRSAEGRERRRIRRLTALGELNRQALAPDVPLELLLRSAVEVVANVLSVPAARIIRAVSGSSELELVAGVGWEWDERLSAGRPGSYVEYVMRAGEPVRVRDFRTETRFRAPRAILASGGISSLAVGLLGTRGSWGIISAHANEPRIFDEEEAGFLGDVANVISLALKAEEAVAFQEQIIAIATHELRTPLTTVIGLSQHLARTLRRKGDEGAADIADTISEGGFELNATIDRWLSLAAAERRANDVPREEFDLCVLVAQRVSDLLTRHPAVGVHESFPAEPMILRSDPGRIREIIDNLLENAARYAGERAEVTATVQMAGSDAHVTIHDSGPGIPAEQRRRVFERFYRGSQESPRRGLGIGLYVSRLLAEQLGGTLTLEDFEGGATFTLALPR